MCKDATIYPACLSTHTVFIRIVAAATMVRLLIEGGSYSRAATIILGKRAHANIINDYVMLYNVKLIVILLLLRIALEYTKATGASLPSLQPYVDSMYTDIHGPLT